MGKNENWRRAGSMPPPDVPTRREGPGATLPATRGAGAGPAWHGAPPASGTAWQGPLRPGHPPALSSAFLAIRKNRPFDHTGPARLLLILLPRLPGQVPPACR